MEALYKVSGYKKRGDPQPVRFGQTDDKSHKNFETFRNFSIYFLVILAHLFVQMQKYFVPLFRPVKIMNQMSQEGQLCACLSLLLYL